MVIYNMAGAGENGELNVEHPTLNAEYRIMKSLRSVVFKKGQIPYSMFNVGRSMFDVYQTGIFSQPDVLNGSLKVSATWAGGDTQSRKMET